MNRIKWWLFAIVFSVLPESCLHAQFPVLLVDTAVHNRLAREWEPANPYQHERGYCLHYTSEMRFTIEGPLAVYTLTGIIRAVEENTGPSYITKMSCPSAFGEFVFLHTHPPIECDGMDLDDGPCRVGGMWASQCYPSVADMRTLNNSSRPFALIQCAGDAIVPYWRTEPLPLVSPPGGSHRW